VGSATLRPYKVVDGALVFQPLAAGGSNLYSEGEYADFQLRFEFQLTPGANSGVGIRAPWRGLRPCGAMEIQIRTRCGSRCTPNLRSALEYHGSVWRSDSCQAWGAQPAGEWNTEEIIARGSHIRVVVNDIVVVDGDVIGGRARTGRSTATSTRACSASPGTSGS
jgi:hypothetical protein